MSEAITAFGKLSFEQVFVLLLMVVVIGWVVRGVVQSFFACFRPLVINNNTKLRVKDDDDDEDDEN